MKFSLKRLTNYSDDEIIKEIKRVADRLGAQPLRKTEFDEESKVHHGTVIRRFGSWEAALNKAGLGHCLETLRTTAYVRRN